MLNDRENILNVLREKPLKVYEVTGYAFEHVTRERLALGEVEDGVIQLTTP